MIGRRSSGGVLMVEMSRTPVSAMYSVRGMGVAVRVSTSTSVRSFFSVSLCVTPKRCSSSMISSPRSLKLTSAESRRWVPMMMSIAALGQAFEDLASAAAGVRKRESISTVTGKAARRSRKVW